MKLKDAMGVTHDIGHLSANVYAINGYALPRQDWRRIRKALWEHDRKYLWKFRLCLFMLLVPIALLLLQMSAGGNLLMISVYSSWLVFHMYGVYLVAHSVRGASANSLVRAFIGHGRCPCCGTAISGFGGSSGSVASVVCSECGATWQVPSELSPVVNP